ncbi:MAG: hypothetical protein K6F17_03565, partial [Lachnospiraceae bacterium]|nr:hypothetical protein [Lachnospiraceae bacterium]
EDYAKEYLGVCDRYHDKKYYATFGQYVLTKDVFDELDKEISEGEHEGEYQLTTALDTVREKKGLTAYVPDGKSFDIGLPRTYYETFLEFGKLKEEE